MDTKQFRLKPIALGIVAVFSAPTFALPTAPTVTNGSATFNTSGSTLTVTNTPNAIINWGSFSIGQKELTKFVQQNSASAVLNRVIGQNPSQILGQLQSNGRVFLINPNGILFGQGSRIDTAGLVASTLNLGDADFLAGKLKFTGTGMEGKVENQGTINTANGGFVYLIAPNVENSGIIKAPNGDILLAAGQSVEIADGLNPALRVQITAAEGQVTNLGQILAESGRIGLHGGIVSNSGTISASSAVAEGGKVYLRATNRIELADTSKVGADGTVGGEVTAIVQKDGQITGELIARGSITAQGDGTGASGGFIDTSAADVRIEDGFLALTRGGEWLIDPADFTIAASGGNISGTTLSSNLGSGNVTILSSSGTAGGNGDIHVNQAVSWSANTLTMTAARDININAMMTASGTSSLVMNTATANGADSAVAGGVVKVGFNADGTFKGRVDFLDGAGASRSGNGFLTINGNGYTVITSLGNQTDQGTGATTLQGMINGYYVLGDNINASATSGWNGGQGFVPIGSFGSPFNGNFDGLGHTISGLTINRGTNVQGLFGSTNFSTISNVGLVGVNISGGSSVGSLAGSMNSGKVLNSYATGTLTGTGTSYTGGLVGFNNGASISNSYASVNVSATNGSGSNVGGLVGESNGAITDSYATGSVTGTGTIGQVGGLVGNALTGSVTRSYATGNVTGNNSVGGLVGTNYVNLSDSFSTGTVTGNGAVGGLVGYKASTTNITGSYASGSVTGNINVGGLVGRINAGGVSDSYSSGTVTGGASSSNIGGLVGLLESGGTVTNSYAFGNVSGGAGSSALGGLVGTDSGGTVTASYWNTETSGQSSSAGGTGLTSAQMRSASNFSGWDFANIWNIDSGTNLSYPYLRNNEQIPHPGLIAGVSPCSVCVWDGGGGSNYSWSYAANWTSDLLPAAGATVTIGSSYGTVLFDVNSLSLVSISASSPVTILGSKSLTLTDSSTFNSLLTINSSGTLNFSGASKVLTATGGVSNAGTINLGGSSQVRLNPGGPAFNNSGVLNITSTNGFSFASTGQTGILNNSGSINIATSYTSWEAIFNNTSTGTLSIASNDALSMQNGQSIQGNISLGTGATLWVSERHGVNTAFNGTTFSGSGTIQVLSGIGPVADFTNVSAPSATLYVNTGGTANILAGTTTFANLTFTGGAVSNQGTLTMTGTGSVGGSATFNNQGTFINNGTLTASSLSLGSGATYKGSGTLTGNLFNNGGTVAPGNSPGTMNITGNYTQGSGGTLLMEIGGLTQGVTSNGYDWLNVSGTATLGGTLQISHFGGFAPVVGNTFNLVNAAGGVSGTFGTVSQPSGYSYGRTYGANLFSIDLQSIVAAASPVTATSSAVTTSLIPINNSLYLGALSADTPLLYASGQSRSTASGSGTLTQTSEMVLPALVPPQQESDIRKEGLSDTALAMLPLFTQLIRDANNQEPNYAYRLTCRR